MRCVHEIWVLTRHIQCAITNECAAHTPQPLSILYCKKREHNIQTLGKVRAKIEEISEPAEGRRTLYNYLAFSLGTAKFTEPENQVLQQRRMSETSCLRMPSGKRLICDTWASKPGHVCLQEYLISRLRVCRVRACALSVSVCVQS